MTLLAILAVAAATGFLGGLFGKGGSAVATPVLAAIGIPPMLAVAGPLPATIPGTLLAAREYRRRGLVDWRTTAWCAGVGLPATIVGALLTRWVPAGSLVLATDVVVLGLGISILVRVRRPRAAVPLDGGTVPGDAGAELGGRVAPAVPSDERTPAAAPTGSVAVELDAPAPSPSRPVPVGATVIAVAAGVGLLAGLLANSGGFLLAPLFLIVLRLPVRMALGTSLVVSAALAVPGTVTHAALGHLDAGFVFAYAAASVPLSALGARTALRIHPERLEVAFGAVLVVLSSLLLVWG